jgi:hypothetical protein
MSRTTTKGANETFEFDSNELIILQHYFCPENEMPLGVRNWEKLETARSCI